MQYYRITSTAALRNEELKVYIGKIGMKISHPFPDTLHIDFDHLPSQYFYTGEFVRVTKCVECDGTGQWFYNDGWGCDIFDCDKCHGTGFIDKELHNG